MFILENEKLFYNGEEVLIPFQGAGKQLLKWKDLFIFRFELEDEYFVANNVIAFHEDGNIKWTISPLPKGPLKSPNLYMNIEVDNENRLLAQSYVGYEYIVEYETGKTINARPGTRPW